MSFLMEEIVLSALVTAWRFAGSPIKRSPFFEMLQQMVLYVHLLHLR